MAVVDRLLDRNGSTELIDAALPSNGGTDTQLSLPNAMSLTGLVSHHQVVPIEFGASGNITALSSTNALTLTIGSL
ncbi:MAG: hypothetical protein ABIP94_13345 [Planctomycetota bacterium]